MSKIQETPGNVGFGRAIANFFKGYVDFKGRSTRAGYWWIMLFLLLIVLGVSFIGLLFVVLLFASTGTANTSTGVTNIGMNTFAVLPLLILYALVFLSLFLPLLTLSIRRYRDAGLGNGAIILLWVSNFVLNLFYNVLKNVSVAGFVFWLLSFFLSIVVFILTLLPSDYLLREGDGNFWVRGNTLSAEPSAASTTAADFSGNVGGVAQAVPSTVAPVIAPAMTALSSATASASSVSADNLTKTGWAVDKHGRVTKMTGSESSVEAEKINE